MAVGNSGPVISRKRRESRSGAHGERTLSGLMGISFFMARSVTRRFGKMVPFFLVPGVTYLNFAVAFSATLLCRPRHGVILPSIHRKEIKEPSERCYLRHSVKGPRCCSSLRHFRCRFRASNATERIYVAGEPTRAFCVAVDQVQRESYCFVFIASAFPRLDGRRHRESPPRNT